MYRLLIVDDEHHIVNWLANLFENTSDLELEILKAYTGTQALSFLEKSKMDIILLDIQMPGINGLQLGEKIRTLWPDTHIVFLTSFNNFDYIYHASKLKNISYLLKSESDENIVSEVRKCAEKIDAEKKNLLIQRKASSYSLLVRHLLQVDLMKELLNGRSIIDIRHMVKERGIVLSTDIQKPFFLAYMRISDYSPKNEADDYTTIYQELPVIASALIRPEDRFAIIPVGSCSFLWILQPFSLAPDSPLSPESYLKNLLEDITDSWRHAFSSSCAILFLSEQVTWENLHRYHLLLQEYDNQKLPRMLRQECFLLTITGSALKLPSERKELPNHISKESLLAQLDNALNHADSSKYYSVLQHLEELILTSKSMHDLYSLEIYGRISSILINYINQYRLQETLALQIDLYPLYYTANFSSWIDACNYLKKLSKNIFSIIVTKETDRKQKLVMNLKDYIKKNLAENLSLASLSERFSYNSSYLSYLFKQTTGIGISEYITKCRIDKANELLSAGKESIAAIAEMTGFDTTQYFSYVYKKQMGITPSEYKLSLQNDNSANQ